METYVFWGLRWLDIATISAIFLGPVFAVIVTRLQDRRREKRDRKVAVLRSLLRTRQIPLHPDRVDALNLIDLEFYGRTKVLIAHKDYIKNLQLPNPTQQSDWDRFNEARHDLFVTLLHEIARDLGYSFDKHDISRIAYAPVLWGQDEARQRFNAALLNDLLQGKRALPVTPMTPTPQNPFPPSPVPNNPSQPFGTT